MPTRWYFSQNTTTFQPAPNGAWTVTSGVTFHPLSKTKGNTSVGAGTSRTSGSTSNPSTRADRVYTSDPLAAGTISGTFSAVFFAYQPVSAANTWLNFHIRLTNNTGTTTGRVLYQGSTATSETSTSTAENYEIANNPGATRIKNSIALTSQSVSAGDRLVIEVGYKKAASNSGYANVIYYGDNSAVSDYALAVGNTTATLVPWVEFSGDILLQDEGSSSGPALGQFFPFFGMA